MSCDQLDNEDEIIVVDGFELGQNYPNPFNPSTQIEFVLEDHGLYTLEIFDIRGNVIRVLQTGAGIPGKYKVTWDSKDKVGNKVPSGIYFYRLSTPTKIQTNRMILLK